jgi:hypothetical protein
LPPYRSRDSARGQPDQIALLGLSPASKQIMDRPPLLRAEKLVAADPNDQTTPASRLEHRHDRMSIGREQHTIPQQVLPRDRADQVEFVANRNAVPLRDLEMVQNELLPFALVGLLDRARHAQRDWQRWPKARAPAGKHGRSEQQ